MARTRLPITEKQFSQQVVDLASLLGWVAYRTWTSIHSPKGFPDLVLVRERVVFVELKNDVGKVWPTQEAWLERLRSAGAEVYLWRPQDFESLTEILRDSLAARGKE